MRRTNAAKAKKTLWEGNKGVESVSVCSRRKRASASMHVAEV